MSDKVKKIIKIGLTGIFVVSTTAFLAWTMETQEGMKIYQKAEELAIQKNLEPEEKEEQEETEKEEETEKKHGINIDALKSYNEDVIGWIRIPDTQIDYPLVKGDDNQFYLKHAWNKEKNAVGAVFLEVTNAVDFSDFNTLIYGHYMRNGSIFGSLEEYKNIEYWKEHPYVYIYDQKGYRQYEIFAAYEANVSAETYRINYNNNTKLQDFVNMCIGKSVIDTGIVPTKDDKIITLSTCIGNGTYRARWVVQARLMSEDITETALEMRNDDFVIDYSETSKGHVSIRCLNEGKSKIKIQVEGPNNTYTYDFSEKEEQTFPLGDGNGEYRLQILENVKDKKYTVVLSADFPVELEDEFAPFIESNEFVNYKDSSELRNQAKRILKDIDDPVQKAEVVYEYVMKNKTYDHFFDYASLITGMLRSQNVPTKLVVGNDGSAYHVWISVWTEDGEWNEGTIYFDSKTWKYQGTPPEVEEELDEEAALEKELNKHMHIEASYLDKYMY